MKETRSNTLQLGNTMERNCLENILVDNDPMEWVELAQKRVQRRICLVTVRVICVP
jgi:hypothetical protein